LVEREPDGGGHSEGCHEGADGSKHIGDERQCVVPMLFFLVQQGFKPRKHRAVLACPTGFERIKKGTKLPFFHPEEPHAFFINGFSGWVLNHCKRQQRICVHIYKKEIKYMQKRSTCMGFSVQQASLKKKESGILWLFFVFTCYYICFVEGLHGAYRNEKELFLVFMCGTIP
jgi:hypothetical protein